MHICQHAHPRNGPVCSVMDSGAYGMGCHVTLTRNKHWNLGLRTSSPAGCDCFLKAEITPWNHPWWGVTPERGISIMETCGAELTWKTGTYRYMVIWYLWTHFILSILVGAWCWHWPKLMVSKQVSHFRPESLSEPNVFAGDHYYFELEHTRCPGFASQIHHPSSDLPHGDCRLGHCSGRVPVEPPKKMVRLRELKALTWAVRHDLGIHKPIPDQVQPRTRDATSDFPAMWMMTPEGFVFSIHRHSSPLLIIILHY